MRYPILFHSQTKNFQIFEYGKQTTNDNAGNQNLPQWTMILQQNIIMPLFCHHFFNSLTSTKQDKNFISHLSALAVCYWITPLNKTHACSWMWHWWHGFKQLLAQMVFLQKSFFIRRNFYLSFVTSQILFETLQQYKYIITSSLHCNVEMM